VKVLLSIAGALALQPHLAAACSDADRALAERAAALVRSAHQIVRYCAACGDAAPEAPDDIADVTVGECAVSVGGTPLDLAHSYIDISQRRFDNLLLLAGGTTDAAPGLRVQSETERGVLIVPDPTPVAPLRVVTAPPQLVVVPPEAATPWLAMLAGGGLATVSFGALVAILAVQRRRRHPLPKALALIDRRR